MLALAGNKNLVLPKKLSHAYMIAGADGSGRSILLRHLCKMALCQGENQPCGSCAHCKKVEEQIHPDVIVSGGGKPLSVEEIRDIRRDTFTRPNEGQRKIYVIFQGDALNASAQNALLKILEEPPSYALFLLVTGESGAMLETICSRCQKLTLRPLDSQETMAWLREKYPNHPDLSKVAERCGGFLGRAKQELDPPKSQTTQDNFHQMPGKQPRRKLKSDEPLGQEQEILLEKGEKLWKTMVAGNELALYQESIFLEKCNKEELSLVLELVRQRLSQQLVKTREKHLLKWVALVEELALAVQCNVKGVQLASWLTAGTFQETGGK